MVERKTNLNEGWRLQSSAALNVGGAELSTPGVEPASWYRADLPATVLGTLVDAGEYGDVSFGETLREVPGQGPPAENFSNHKMPSDSPFAVPWWFRREFHVPPDTGECITLQLDGVNYRANVWLNGERIASNTDVVGSYRMFEIDVTALVRRDGPNVLAIEVAAPKPCDLAITWVDWNPSPPDKNMGIWRDVWLRHSGPVALRDPQVVTDLTDDRSRAELVVGGDLINRLNVGQVAIVRGEVAGVAVEKRFELGAGEHRRFKISPADAPGLSVKDPQLWWPRFMGEPTLHSARLEVVVAERGRVRLRNPHDRRGEERWRPLGTPCQWRACPDPRSRLGSRSVLAT